MNMKKEPEPLRIRMKATAAGPAGNFQSGKEYSAPGNMSVEQAQAFLAGGYAELVAAPVVVLDPADEKAGGELTVTSTGDAGKVDAAERIRSRTRRGGKKADG